MFMLIVFLMLGEVYHPTYANFVRKVITAGELASRGGRYMTGLISLHLGLLHQGVNRDHLYPASTGTCFPLVIILVTGVGKNYGGVCDMGLLHVCMYQLCSQKYWKVA